MKRSAVVVLSLIVILAQSQLGSANDPIDTKAKVDRILEVLSGDITELKVETPLKYQEEFNGRVTGRFIAQINGSRVSQFSIYCNEDKISEPSILFESPDDGNIPLVGRVSMHLFEEGFDSCITTLRALSVASPQHSTHLFLKRKQTIDKNFKLNDINVVSVLSVRNINPYVPLLEDTKVVTDPLVKDGSRRVGTILLEKVDSPEIRPAFP